MPTLQPSDSLAPHFSASELGVAGLDSGAAPAQAEAQVAAWLEAARAIVSANAGQDIPFRVTSGYRSPEGNAAAGGVADSEHLTGYAADFVPEGVTKIQVYQWLKAAQAQGTLPPFDELIYYAADDHIHVGVRPTFRGNLEVAIVEGGAKRYLVLTDELAATFLGALPGAPGDQSGGRGTGGPRCVSCGR